MDKEEYLKINEVAKFLGVTTTTIRYYESYGLIKPSYTDKSNSYRYFSLSDVLLLSYIISLRNSGLSMMELKSFINKKITTKDIVDLLTAKRDYLNRMITRNESRLAVKGQFIITEHKADKDYNAFEIKLKAKTIDELIDEYCLTMNNLIKSGKVSMDNEYMDIVLFKDSIRDFEHIDATLYLIIEKPCEGSTLFTKRNYIKTCYRGSYQNLHTAYQALLNYAESHNLTPTGDTLEAYRESFFLSNNPDEFLTEVFLVVE